MPGAPDAAGSILLIAPGRALRSVQKDKTDTATEPGLTQVIAPNVAGSLMRRTMSRSMFATPGE